MKLLFLGSRGEIKPKVQYHINHSGILINDELLLDVGEEKFLQKHPKWILITHLHPDHAFFAKDGVVFDSKKLPQTFAPEKKNFFIQTARKPFSLGKYQITPIPTIHSKKVKSQAYRIEAGGKSLLYTGDLIWIKKQYHHLLADLDLVICEGSYIRQGGLVRRDPQTGQIYGHTGIPDLVNFFKKFTNKIVITHFGSWFFKDIAAAKKKIKKLAKKHQVEIMVGYDGLELVV